MTTLDILANAPECVRQAIITVPGPSQQLAHEDVCRRRQLHALLSRYERQLLLGCEYQYCTTSTCATYRRRASQGPYRRWTIKSARALAYSFVSEEDPEARLCPHLSSGHTGQNLAGGVAEAHDDPVEPASSQYDRQLLNSAGSDGGEIPRLGVGSFNSRRSPMKGNPATESTRHCEGEKQHPRLRNDPKSFAGAVFGSAAFDSARWRGIAGPSTGLRSSSQGTAREVYSRGNKQRSWNGALMPWLNDAPNSAVEFRKCTPKGQRRSAANGTRNEAENRGVKMDSCQSCASLTTTTLSHLSAECIEALIILMTMERANIAETPQYDPSKSNEVMDLRSSDSWCPYCESNVEQFFRQSIFYVLSQPDRLLESFQSSNKPDKISMTAKERLRSAIPDMYSGLKLLADGAENLMMHSLWVCAGALFIPPPELCRDQPARREAKEGSPSHISGESACYIVAASLYALIALYRDASGRDESLRRKSPQGGGSHHISPKPEERAASKANLDSFNDGLENDLAQRLLRRILRGIAARIYHEELLLIRQPERPGRRRRNNNCFIALYDEVLRSLDPKRLIGCEKDSTRTNAGVLVDWIRVLISQGWNGSPRVERFGAVGSAIIVLSHLNADAKLLDLDRDEFRLQFIADNFHALKTPVAWLQSPSNNTTIHVLDYPFLFHPRDIVTYFRTINYAKMAQAYSAALERSRLIAHLTDLYFRKPFYDTMLHGIKKFTRPHLILDIRREHVYSDAMDQIWRRERRELMLPLKIRFGMKEGEEGVDHGGVQQEFFCMAVAEALNPDHGMFTTDPLTHMSWFQTRSLEPLYRFEMFGLLVSLAIYNGVTLPVTFPLVLYMKLLDVAVNRLNDLSDGWPELSRGLVELLDWTDGDVADVFMRTYQFGTEAWGEVIYDDVSETETAGRRDSRLKLNGASAANLTPSTYKPDSRLPSTIDPAASPTPEEPRLVTNSNRHGYVRDYIDWLTNQSVASQFEAFARGFRTCLSSRTATLFSPTALQLLVQGSPYIDLPTLKAATAYESFTAEHPLIQAFWSILSEYSPQQLALLLEFVTASGRLPVGGVSRITFVIQKNGGDSERLPTSLTCFGRLLLPEYEGPNGKGDEEGRTKKLRTKLDKALENGRGFGVP